MSDENISQDLSDVEMKDVAGGLIHAGGTTDTGSAGMQESMSATFKGKKKNKTEVEVSGQVVNARQKGKPGFMGLDNINT